MYQIVEMKVVYVTECLGLDSEHSQAFPLSNQVKPINEESLRMTGTSTHDSLAHFSPSKSSKL